MAVLPILQIRPGNPDSSTDILRTPAREVTDFSPALHDLAADLLDTLRRHGAARIAAPQAGIPLRLAVVEQERGPPLVLVNPRITEEAEPVSEGPEACLSLPGSTASCRVPGPWSWNTGTSPEPAAGWRCRDPCPDHRPRGGSPPRDPLHRPGDPGHGRAGTLKSRAFTRRGRRTGGRRRSSSSPRGPSARRRRSA